MTFQLVTTSNFDRRLALFRRVHPQLRLRLARVFVDLETDPFQPHLRLHPLKGELAGLHTVSVTYAYRLTLILRVTENEIVLLDIGSHDEVCR
jgi:mRNA-degrading endonuclease YafQ of YafQ-DinJ toxin-antitoxin module